MRTAVLALLVENVPNFMLPNLPKQKKKREAEFGLKFRLWLLEHRDLFPSSAVFELKQTQTDRIPFKSVEIHQLVSLRMSSNNDGVMYKIPDDSRSVKPYDYFYIKNAYAYVVIKFPKHFSIISIDSFIGEQNNCGKTSLTSDRARQIAWMNV